MNLYIDTNNNAMELNSVQTDECEARSVVDVLISKRIKVSEIVYDVETQIVKTIEKDQFDVEVKYHKMNSSEIESGSLCKIFITPTSKFMVMMQIIKRSPFESKIVMLDSDSAERLSNSLFYSVELKRIVEQVDSDIFELSPYMPTYESSQLFIYIMNIDIIFDTIIGYLRGDYLRERWKNVYNLSIVNKAMNSIVRSKRLKNYTPSRLENILISKSENVKLYIPIIENNIYNFNLLDKIITHLSPPCSIFADVHYLERDGILWVIKKMFINIGESRRLKQTRPADPSINPICLSDKETIALMKRFRRVFNWLDEKYYRQIVSKAIIRSDYDSLEMVRDYISNKIVLFREVSYYIDARTRKKLASRKTADYFLAHQKCSEAVNFYSSGLFCREVKLGLIKMLVRNKYYVSASNIIYNESKSIDRIKNLIILPRSMMTIIQNDPSKTFELYMYQYKKFLSNLKRIAKNQLNSWKFRDKALIFIRFINDHLNRIKLGHSGMSLCNRS